jgi:hypothetical protein
MRSRREADLLDLEAGIPTTEEDTRALRRTRFSTLDFETYLDFLESFDDADPSLLIRRRGAGGSEKFEL